MNAITRPQLAQRMFNTPLLMHPGKFSAALSGLGARVVDGEIVFDGPMAIEHVAFEHGRPSAGRIGDRLGREIDSIGALPFDVVGNVAVIAIEGTLIHKGGWVGSYSGMTTYQGLQTQIIRAMRSPAIRGVVFEVDSFGGEVSGAFETAGMIQQLSAAKPTLAILTDHAYSAGYLLASAAREIVMPKLGGAGSIGVLVGHVDYSKLLERHGVKVTLLHAGKHKVEGNPYEPLPDEVAAKWQANLEEARRYFADFVGRQRGDRFTQEDALATEADDYSGDRAVELGLVDGVGDANAAFEAFIAAVNAV